VRLVDARGQAKALENQVTRYYPPSSPVRPSIIHSDAAEIRYGKQRSVHVIPRGALSGRLDDLVAWAKENA
jgi:hypothetical protein